MSKGFFNRKKVQKWRDFISGMDIENLFANRALQRRAWNLYREDACTLISINDYSVIAQVRGRTDEYRAVLSLIGYGMEFQCTCPSIYYPCKHIGALLYTLRNRPVPSEVRNCPFQKSGVPVGKVKENARFRTVFLLTQKMELADLNESVLGIEPVLVYKRKDGHDGRIEKFNCRTARLPGNSETEELLRRWESGGGRPIRAISLCSYWCARLWQQGKSRLELPVELFLERSGRLEREKRAEPRCIRKVSIRWIPEDRSSQGIRYRSHISLSDEQGYSETRLREHCPVEQNDELLLIPNIKTGVLWYLSHLNLSSMYFGKLGDLAALLDLDTPVNLTEISSFKRRCRSHFHDLVDIHNAPAHVEIIHELPVPVMDIEPERSSSREYPFTIMKLHFYYSWGNQKYTGRSEGREECDTSPSERTALIPVTVEADSARCIARDHAAEEVCTQKLFTVFKEMFQPEQIDLYDDFPHRFMIEAAAYDVVSLIADELLSLGFEVRLKQRKVKPQPGKAAIRITASGEEWLRLEAGFDAGDHFVPIENITARGVAVAGDDAFVLSPGSDTEILLAALQKERVGRRDFSALEEISGIVSNPDHPAMADFFSLRKKLASFSSLQEVEVPGTLQGELRSYQKSGLSWLWFLHMYQLGGCLADDMGLGKTIQTLALLAKARENGEMRRALVVCPVSTLGNWQREVRTFTPQFSAGIHCGPDRARIVDDLEAYDIILVGYDTMWRDVRIFRELPLDYLVLDEAQAIKNPKTRRRQAAASIHAPHRLALTGTPIENSTLELWSLFDFLMPGILGSRASFSGSYGSDIESECRLENTEAGSSAPGSSPGKDHEKADALRRILRPLLLRRTKEAVAPELPPRKELLLYAESGYRQARVYESLREKYAEEVEALMAEGCGGNASLKILEAMLRLRQAAILPSLVDPDFSGVAGAKIDLLLDRLIELREEGNKALVFSQFTGVLDEVALGLSKTGVQPFRLDGSTPQDERDRQISEFQNVRGSSVFLISLKAGGLGINLTAADYVFLLDPWWNPAVEAQAIDRAHRIGRERAVIAYRLITKGTIEEKILRLQEKKRRIADSLIKGESGSLRGLSREEILGLFQVEGNRNSSCIF